MDEASFLDASEASYIFVQNFQLNYWTGLQKTANAFCSEHVFQFYSIFGTKAAMILFYQKLSSKNVRSKIRQKV